ncbi:MAG: ABC transporter substrate-binding protein [Pseudomonadota bacterium]
MRHHWIIAALIAALGQFAAPAAARAEAVFVEHIWGTTRVPEVPRRVVSLSYNGADNWLALGVTPYAYRVWYGGDETGLWPWAASELGAEEPLQLRGEIDIEAVARLEPDLIEAMYSGLTRAEYRALSRVAPVLGPPPGRGDFAATWTDMVVTFGRVMRREAAARAVVSRIEGAFARTRAAHPAWQGATAVVALPDGPLILTGEDGRMQVLMQLGFTLHPPAEALSHGGFFYRMDPELTAPLESDLLMWLDLGGGVGAAARNPLRSAMRSVAEGREVVADPLLSAALSYASALSLSYALERLPGMLDAALDGDPKTVVASALAAGLAP